MTYEEEKKYLCDKCAEYIIKDNVTNCIYPLSKDDNKLMLTYFGEKVETELAYMYTEGDDEGYIVFLKSTSNAYPEDYAEDKEDFSPLDEFSNDEIKAIMQKFGIEY